MGEGRKETFWKTISFTCITSIFLMCGFWLVEVKGYVSQDKVSQMIQRESPYLLERELIRTTLDDVRVNLKANTQVLNSLNVEIARLRAEIERIVKP